MLARGAALTKASWEKPQSSGPPRPKSLLNLSPASNSQKPRECGFPTGYSLPLSPAASSWGCMSVPRWPPPWESSCHGNTKAAPADAKGAGGQRLKRDMNLTTVAVLCPPPPISRDGVLLEHRWAGVLLRALWPKGPGSSRDCPTANAACHPGGFGGPGSGGAQK